MVDSCPSPLKEGGTHKNRKTRLLANDVLPLKPMGSGRDDAFQDQSGEPSGGYVRKCGRSRCKTCAHITEGHTFVSIVTGRKYNTISSELTMTCNTENIVYLISCRKCGIQYNMGETSQVLRRRMNNHRNRLKNLGEQYLYKHLCI